MPGEPISAARIRIIQVFSLMGAFVIAGALIWLHVLESESLASLAQEQYQRDTQIVPQRGSILDANRTLLATAKYLNDVEVAPNVVQGSGISANEIASELTELLGMPQEKIAALIDQPDKRYALLARGVTPDTSERIEQLVRSGEVPGITLSAVPYRTYPLGMLAAHVVGFYSQSGSGQYGVEGYYEDLLQGAPGRRLSSSAPFGGEAGEATWVLQPAEPGADLVLTLDGTVQHIVERELEAALERYGASAGTIIVMEPYTGAIIAMASRPTYDSNKYQEFHSPNEDAYANPAISLLYEPGSTFKVFTLAGALDAGIITPEVKFNDVGSMEYWGVEIKNWDEKGHGESDMTDLIARSSNVGAVWVGDQLGKDLFYEYVTAFGFGAPTGVDLWGEVNGLVPDPNSRYWYPSSLATNAFGQGIAVTPLQLITAVSALINDGVLMQPYVVQEVHTEAGVQRIEPRAVRRVVRKDSARTLVSMLVEASKRSESKMHIVDGYDVAGKTGTASIPLETGGYHAELTIASYVGFGPVESPRFAILVKIDHPTVEPWGSLVAAPVFREVASELFRYYHIPRSAPQQTLVQEGSS
ncbi:MAG: penicillin-binding protein 2 [Chloroflexi bacterium]|nr:penicillin-binding protein 2 [Chloroflexota bacterium]